MLVKCFSPYNLNLHKYNLHVCVFVYSTHMCKMYQSNVSGIKNMKATVLNLIFNMCAIVQYIDSDRLRESQFLNFQNFYI